MLERVDPSFNGAALFQVRKRGAERLGFWRSAIASMGPHFFKCGNCYQSPAVLAIG